METYICSVCLEAFPRTLDYFHRGRTADGFSPTCKECANQRTRAWKAANPDRKYLNPVTGKLVGSHVLSRNRLRDACLRAHGGEPPCCSCCGEHRLEFLALHHLDGGGGKHRKSVGNMYTLMRQIRDAGFPPGYGVLCHNCNQSLGYNGYCPHELERETK